MSNAIVTSSDLIYNKLNEVNPGLPYPLTPDNIVLGTPTPNTNTNISKNSAITFTGKTGSKYRGNNTAYYDRVDLATITATIGGGNVFPLTTQKNISDVLPLYNSTYTVNVVASDIVDGPLPAGDPASGQIAFNLTAVGASYAFKGVTGLVFKPADASLATLITTTTLSGFTGSSVLALTAPGWQSVLDQVNKDNPSFPRKLNSTNVDHGTPAVLTGDASGKNTSVSLTGKTGQGVNGTNTFKYNRVGLLDLINASANPSPIVPNTSQATVGDLVASFNSQYGAKLTAADLTNVFSDPLAKLPGSYIGTTLLPVASHPLYNAGQEVKYKAVYPTLTLSGTLPSTLTGGTAYNQSLTIAGGSGVYSNPRVLTGTFPSYLSLSISGNKVVVAGTPTSVGGDFSFVIAVDSDDGQTANSAVQTMQANGGATPSLTTLITNVNPSGLTLAQLKATV